MLLSAFVFAAALQAAPAAQPEAKPFTRAPRIVSQRSPLECRQRAMQARDDASAKGRPLNQMRLGLLHHAVIRMVDGCPVSTQVRQVGPAH